jgi:chemotaxis protein MotB
MSHDFLIKLPLYATAEGRATNCRTRIIIMPKLDQFYDPLNPNNAPK